MQGVQETTNLHKILALLFFTARQHPVTPIKIAIRNTPIVVANAAAIFVQKSNAHSPLFSFSISSLTSENSHKIKAIAIVSTKLAKRDLPCHVLMTKKVSFV